MTKLKKFILNYYPENIVIMSYVWTLINLLLTQGLLQLINMAWLFIGVSIYITYRVNLAKIEYLEVKLSSKK